MSAYTPDFTKTPAELILGLVNHDNNKGYLVADVEMLEPTVQTPDADGRDTYIDIDLEVDPSEQEDDFVRFFYERVSLSTLFSLVNPNFREVDVPLNDNGLPVDAATFYAEILRKFGVAMTETDFEYALKSANVITVKAKATNVAYTGEFDIAVANSLATRIVNTVLNGFEAPAKEPAPAV